MGLFGFGKKEKDKMKDGLEKTRTGFWGNIMNTLTGSKIDDDLYDELEEQLDALMEESAQTALAYEQQAQEDAQTI